MYNLIISMTNSTTNFFIGFIILSALLFVGATIADLGIDLSSMDGPNVTGCKIIGGICLLLTFGVVFYMLSFTH